MTSAFYNTATSRAVPGQRSKKCHIVNDIPNRTKRREEDVKKYMQVVHFMIWKPRPCFEVFKNEFESVGDIVKACEL